MHDLREDPWEEGAGLHETEQRARVRKGNQPGKGHVARRNPDRLCMGVAAWGGRQWPEHMPMVLQKSGFHSGFWEDTKV